MLAGNAGVEAGGRWGFLGTIPGMNPLSALFLGMKPRGGMGREARQIG